ncbi:E3 ubiquitin-protein ligase PUB23 [Platanthera zijinensis]|uniref:U-box domain-containing protein n=1 Tax=Platanthera zijinensis TaxID=2320716 RepID=A0AAP0GBD0_9ASPA
MELALVQIPSYFLCPISLQIMRDPVTLPTGITYDRDSIERWLYSGHHNTCPVTNQPVLESDLITPNHTLRRLIQSWCSSNASHGVERFPTPRPPVDKYQIATIIDEARRLPNSQLLPSLFKLKKIVSDGERNKRCVEGVPGAIDFLVSVISNEQGNEEAAISACDEAVNILYSLQLSQGGLLDLFERNEDLLNSLAAVLRLSVNYQTRAYVVLIVKTLLRVVPSTQLMSIRQEFFEGMVKVLKDRISYQATKAVLQVLYGVCPWGRNMVKTVQAGAVPVLLNLLLDEPEKRASEMMMVVLDVLCGCADGREEVIRHAAGLAVVSKKMMRVSPVATEKAVMILYSILSYPTTSAVLEEMLQVGVVNKLCMLLQVECGNSTRKMVKEMLRMHLSAWRRSSCLTPQLKALYLSS